MLKGKTMKNIRLATMLLKNRKKIVFGIIGLIATAGVLANLAFFTARLQVEQKISEAERTYGSYVCGLNRLSDEDIAKLQEIPELAIGCYENFGMLKKENSVLTLGFVDEQFLEMVNMHLLKGRMPKQEKEVALEKFVAELFGIDEPGEMISLKYGGYQEEVKVCGIVENYSNALNVNVDVSPLERNYPNLLFSKNRSSLDAEVYQSALLSDRTMERLELDHRKAMQRIYGYFRKYDREDLVENTYENDNLYNRGLQYCMEIRLMGYLFSGILLVAIATAVLTILSAFYYGYEEKLGVFQVYGLSPGASYCICLIQLCFFTGVGCLWSMMISRAFNELIRFAYQDSLLENSVADPLFLVVWNGLLLAIEVCFFYGKYRTEKRKSITYLLAPGSYTVFRGVKNRKLHFDYVNHLSGPRGSWILLFALLYLICYGSLVVMETAKNNYAGYPDYSLIAKRVSVSENRDGYSIEYDTDLCYSDADMEGLQALSKQIAVDGYPNNKNTTLLFDKQKVPTYFQKWKMENDLPDTDAENSIIYGQWPQEAEQYTPIPNVNFVVLNPEELEALYKSMGREMSSDILKKKNGILLFVPDALENQIEVKKGDFLLFGGVDVCDDGIRFRTEKLELFDVLEQEYEFERGVYCQKRDGITVVLTKNCFEESQLFSGYGRAEIYVPAEMDSDIREKMDDYLNIMQSKLQGGVFYSKRSMEEMEAEYARYVRVLGILLLILIFSISGITVGVFMHNYMIRNRKNYGILRALGMSEKVLINRIFYGFVHSMEIGALLGLAIGLFFDENTDLLIKNGGCAFVFVSMVLCMMRYFLRRQIQNMQIGNMLKDAK